MKKLLKSFLIPLIALVVGMPAYAFDDWQEMTAGVPLSYTTAWSAVGGTFTLDEETTVKLTITSNNSYGVTDGFNLYNSTSLESPLLNSNKEEGAGIYTLPAGTYYFYCMSVWGSGSIMYSEVAGGITLTINEITPADGSVFGPSANNGFLSFSCDFVILAESWQLVSDKYTSDVYYLNSENQGVLKYLSIYVAPELNKLFNKGLTTGDSFQIVINGIKDPNDNLYGEDGTVTLNYKVGNPVLDLVSSSLDRNSKNLLLSYYLPGDEAALVSFTFNSPFDPNHSQVVMPYIDGIESAGVTKYGPVLELACTSTSTAQKLYYEGTYSNDNKTVTFDISGYDFGTWGGALGADGAQPVYKVLNIYDLEGNNSLGGDESTPGAYSFSTDYRQYQQANFDCTWIPAAGAYLTDETTVNIATTITDDTGVKNRIRSFDSITFTAADGTEVAVPFSQCTFNYTNEALGKLTISCPTPARVKELNNVTVRVNGLHTCDNMTYSDGMISADFNPEYIDPSPYITFGSVDANGLTTKSGYVTSLATINVYTDLIYDGSIPTLTCSDPSVTREIWYVNTNPSTDSDGNNYYAINIGQSVALTSVNGASVVSEGTTFSISFPARSFSSNLSDAVYDAISYTYTFTNESEPDPDPEPDPEPEPEPEDFSIAIISPAAGTVYSLDKIIVTFDGTTYIQTSGNAQAYLLDSNDNRYSLKSDIGNMDNTIDWLVPDGWTTVETGNYTLVVEEGYYITDNGSESINRELRVNYTLAEAPGEDGCDLNVYTDEYYSRPASIPVESLGGLYFEVAGASKYSVDDTAGTPTLVTDDGTELASYQFGFDLLNEDKKISLWMSYYGSANSFTLTIPQGYIVATLGGENVGCKALNLTVNVVGTQTPVVEVAGSTANASVNSLKGIGLNFDGIENSIPNLEALSITVKRAATEICSWTGATWKTTAFTPRYEDSYLDFWGNAVQSEKPAYVFPLTADGADFSTPGTYKVTVAEKSFIVLDSAPAAVPGKRMAAGDGTPRYTKAMTYSFTVTESTAIDAIAIDEASEYVVYNLAGRLVMKTSARTDLNNLVGGFYIINGKKAFVK